MSLAGVALAFLALVIGTIGLLVLGACVWIAILAGIDMWHEHRANRRRKLDG
jgi:uncharacterized iron-regulated membrane protein